MKVDSGMLLGFVVHNSHKQGRVNIPHVERKKMNTIPAITFGRILSLQREDRLPMPVKSLNVYTELHRKIALSKVSI